MIFLALITLALTASVVYLFSTATEHNLRDVGGILMVIPVVIALILTAEAVVGG